MRILLLTPPMTQLNTPYPATAYLTGFLRSRGFDARQADPAIELVLRLLSAAGIQRMAEALGSRVTRASKKHMPASIAHFLAHAPRYQETVEPVIRFLQNRDPSLALRIASRDFLPEGPRFATLDGSADAEDPLVWAFGAMGTQDQAKYLASLYVDDLADVIREGIDPRFELSRYGEKLASSAPSFDPLQAALDAEPTLVDQALDAITAELLDLHFPAGTGEMVLGLTAPFPGNVYGAFRIARTARALRPELRIVLGGGFVNTELRDLKDPRVFDYVDYITLDDGERPLLTLLEHLRDGSAPLLRTFVREEGEVVLKTDPTLHDLPQKDLIGPTYDGLPLDRYLSLFEMLNPMHRIWSDGRWNKLTLAHGCYWKKCNFCDVGLDYIGRYDPAPADAIVDKMERLIAETGQSGFHFVDEAAPPALLRAVSERLIARGVVATWWGNIRFDKTFTPGLAGLMARAGCVALSGGLEVASDRLLKLMQKGVTVEQVARVTRAFTDAGIMVHAYLMYGFPTQTAQETVDSLERVRQLFEAGCIQSAFWHRLSVTAHSPMGKDPEKFGITLLPEPETTFARNDLAFTDPTGADHEMLGNGLRKALYNYMHGVGEDADVRSWFARAVPATHVPPDLIARALGAAESA